MLNWLNCNATFGFWPLQMLLFLLVLMPPSFVWSHLHKLLIWHVLDSFTSGAHPQSLFKSSIRVKQKSQFPFRFAVSLPKQGKTHSFSIWTHNKKKKKNFAGNGFCDILLHSFSRQSNDGDCFWQLTFTANRQC